MGVGRRAASRRFGSGGKSPLVFPELGMGERRPVEARRPGVCEPLPEEPISGSQSGAPTKAVKAMAAMATTAAAPERARRAEERGGRVDSRRRATESGGLVNLAASGRWAAAVALQDEPLTGAGTRCPRAGRSPVGAQLSGEGTGCRSGSPSRKRLSPWLSSLDAHASAPGDAVT